MTDPANDSSRSGPKFWKHSAPRIGWPGRACVSIFFSPENASHSLSKTYGRRSLLLFCPIDPQIVRSAFSAGFLSAPVCVSIRRVLRPRNSKASHLRIGGGSE